MRDDFSQRTIDILAARAGGRCSNPRCRQLTSGPRTEPDKAVNIGVAAHITAAAASGPRYDPDLTPEARRHADNGLWLCQNCAKLVDNDPTAFPVHLLRAWKRQAEDAARHEVEQGTLLHDAGARDIHDGMDPDRARHPTQIGGAIQADRIEAHNVVSGVQIVGGPAGPKVEDMCQQVAALREQLGQGIAAERTGDKITVDDAQGAPPTAEEEPFGPEPRDRRISRELKEVKKVREE
jgi:hypothetical protein